LSSQLRETEIVAARGAIYDTNGKILAMSAPVENVFISPFELERDNQDVRFIAEGLSYILGVEYEFVLERAARTSSQYQVIKHRVESREAERVREFINEHKLKGIYFEAASRRYYPNDNLASQILGFVGTDNTGLDGIEHRYDNHLTGVSGRIVRLTNAKGTDLMFAGYGDFYDALDGSNITLTVDLSVQYYMEKHLAQAIEDYDVLNGAMCIAMNPKTGEILGIVNYPNFDPNNFTRLSERELERLSVIEDEDEYKEAVRGAQFRQWRNRALADTYEPGSVFKILTLAMALEENAATPDSQFYCDGAIDIQVHGDVSVRNCWRRWGHGMQSLSKSMHNSCNVACIELGLRVGARTFYKYIDAFGLFNRTGLDSGIEGRSLWWDDDVFFDRGNLSQLASASFGQTFKVTPIQMITAASATINGGYLMQPYMVKQITDSSGNIVEAAEPTVLRQVISANTSSTMRTILEDVVEIGTGKNAQVKGYRIGGKTGTSENIEQVSQWNENEDGNLKDYITSFIGFAPADDPEIIILLLLDTPSHETGIYISGGSMAAPVVGKMLADILPLSLGVMPQYTPEDIKDINVHVPRITGRSVDDAISHLEGLGFEHRIVGDGETATAQLPAPNAHVASGTLVIIYAGGEVPREHVTVPQLSGLRYSEARKELENRGLFIRTAGAPKSDSKVLVSVQSIHAGREAAYGSIVEVTLIDREVVEQRVN
jgi:stage V sporulation protein D (sporulation-specific penicillin-binding protein)